MTPSEIELLDDLEDEVIHTRDLAEALMTRYGVLLDRIHRVKYHARQDNRDRCLRCSFIEPADCHTFKCSISGNPIDSIGELETCQHYKVHS